MRLSIITVNYNNINGLRRTIESVKQQSFRDFEWIVIDGGSTDGSKELIDENKELFSYWQSCPDDGVFPAMNIGVTKASGEWLQFLNSGDSLYERDTLSRVFSQDYDCDVLYGDAEHFDHTGSWFRTFPDKLGLNFFWYNTLNHQSTFFRRELLEEQPYDVTYTNIADYIYYISLIFRNKSFQHLSQVITSCEPSTIGHRKFREEVEGANDPARMFGTYIPTQIRYDIEQFKDYKFMHMRKSFRIIYNVCYKFCGFLNKILLLIDKK